MRSPHTDHENEEQRRYGVNRLKYTSISMVESKNIVKRQAI